MQRDDRFARKFMFGPGRQIPATSCLTELSVGAMLATVAATPSFYSPAAPALASASYACSRPLLPAGTGFGLERRRRSAVCAPLMNLFEEEEEETWGEADLGVETTSETIFWVSLWFLVSGFGAWLSSFWVFGNTPLAWIFLFVILAAVNSFLTDRWDYKK